MGDYLLWWPSFLSFWQLNRITSILLTLQLQLFLAVCFITLAINTKNFSVIFPKKKVYLVKKFLSRAAYENFRKKVIIHSLRNFFLFILFICPFFRVIIKL